jgi:hypothetical protein
VERVTIGDRELIASQMGRAPRGNYAIACRCVHGHPQVLRVPPVVDEKPFPTLYWLTCPFLCRAVSELEAEGWVGRLEQRLAAEAELRAALDRADGEYVAARRELLSVEEEKELARRGQLRELEARGIGGIADRTRLKCLHLHVAHALAGRNPIGEIALHMLVRPACEAEKTICSSLVGERSRSTDQPIGGSETATTDPPRRSAPRSRSGRESPPSPSR